MNDEKKVKQAHSSAIATNAYHPEDDSLNKVKKGMAQTHEQVSDTFTRGTVDDKVEKENE